MSAMQITHASGTQRSEILETPAPSSRSLSSPRPRSGMLAPADGHYRQPGGSDPTGAWGREIHFTPTLHPEKGWELHSRLPNRGRDL